MKNMLNPLRKWVYLEDCYLRASWDQSSPDVITILDQGMLNVLDEIFEPFDELVDDSLKDTVSGVGIWVVPQPSKL